MSGKGFIQSYSFKPICILRSFSGGGNDGRWPQGSFRYASVSLPPKRGTVRDSGKIQRIDQQLYLRSWCDLTARQAMPDMIGLALARAMVRLSILYGMQKETRRDRKQYTASTGHVPMDVRTTVILIIASGFNLESPSGKNSAVSTE